MADDQAGSRSDPLVQKFSDALVEIAKSERLYEGSFEDVTEIAARTLGVARASVWLYNEDRTAIHCVDLYELLEDRHSEGAELAAKDHPAYFRALSRERCIAAHDARRDPRTANFTEGYLAPLGITSMLDAPIWSRGEMVGVFCNEHVGPVRQWTAPEQRFAGSMADFCAVALEAAERRRVEAALRESETRYRVLFESANDGLFLLDGERFVECNPATAHLFGCSREDLIGRTPVDFSPPRQPDGRGSEESAKEKIHVALGGAPLCFEWRHCRLDGSEFDAEVSLTRLDLSPKPYLLAIVRDITARKRAERELAAYRNRLEELVQQRTAELREAQAELVRQERLAALGQVAATVSHEIRNPLQTIRGSFYIVADMLGDAPPQVLDVLDRIERNIIRCDQIIEDLVDYTSEKELRPEPTALDEWLDAVLDEQVWPRELEVVRRLRSGAVVSVDRERLRRCVENIILNACQAFEEQGAEAPGGASPRLIVETETLGRRVEIRFRDNGPGIPPDKLEAALQPFYSTKGFGVGLGLTIARRVAEQHGGGVRVAVEDAGGAAVTLWLPLGAPQGEPTP